MGYGPFERGSGLIFLDNVQCTGDEETLLECPSHEPGKHDCGIYDDAGVFCPSEWEGGREGEIEKERGREGEMDRLEGGRERLRKREVEGGREGVREEGNVLKEEEDCLINGEGEREQVR